jgi:hypothetical protein
VVAPDLTEPLPSCVGLLTNRPHIEGWDGSESLVRATEIEIAGHSYRVRTRDTLRWQRARSGIQTLPPVLSERDWVAAWIELIDASVQTPRGTPRAGRLLRELYRDDAIRLREIRDTGLSLLPEPEPVEPEARKVWRRAARVPQHARHAS